MNQPSRTRRRAPLEAARPFRSSRLDTLRRTTLVAGILLAANTSTAPARAAGTWTKAPSNSTTGGQAFGLWLLTDGTVLSHGSALNHWVILTPDKKGSYANGTWKSVASSTHARGGAQQHILKDGRFFQAGGEYIDGPACTTQLCPTAEIYDPVADMWMDIPSAPYDIGDTGSATLSDGRVLDSTRNGNQIQIYDPTTNKWTMGAPMPLKSGDENAWSSLQNGGVLAVGYQTDGAAIYNPATDKWTRTTVPSGFNTGDTGGISLMFDGRVFVYGIGQSYIYTPGPTASDPGTWALGPKLLNGDEAEDEYSDTLPNGKVWGGLVQKTYGPGVVLQEFDPMTNAVSSAMPPPDMGNPYPIDYVNLPNGQVMVTCDSADWIYTPDTPPQDAWRPTATSVTHNDGNTYTLTGTQLSGLINGADEGDDMTMAENYPIVFLTDEGGDVYYCRTFNFSTMMPHAGSDPQTCQFTTPAGLPEGTYNLFVSAVGVVSKNALPFTVGVGGTLPPDAGTTTGTADAGSASDAASRADAAPSDAGAGGSNVTPVPDGGAPGSSSGAAGGGGPTATGANGASPGHPGAPQGNQSGCGCRTVGGNDLGPLGVANLLALAGVGAAVGVRRVRRRPGPSTSPRRRF